METLPHQLTVEDLARHETLNTSVQVLSETVQRYSLSKPLEMGIPMRIKHTFRNGIEVQANVSLGIVNGRLDARICIEYTGTDERLRHTTFIVAPGSEYTEPYINVIGEIEESLVSSILDSINAAIPDHVAQFEGQQSKIETVYEQARQFLQTADILERAGLGIFEEDMKMIMQVRLVENEGISAYINALFFLRDREGGSLSLHFRFVDEHDDFIETDNVSFHVASGRVLTAGGLSLESMSSMINAARMRIVALAIVKLTELHSQGYLPFEEGTDLIVITQKNGRRVDLTKDLLQEVLDLPDFQRFQRLAADL
jgi:hypothetical protein